MLAFIPLIGGVTGGVVTGAYAACRAGPLLCSDCHSPVGGRVCSSVARVEAFPSGSELLCEVDGTASLLLGKEPLNILPQEQSTKKCAL